MLLCTFLATVGAAAISKLWIPYTLAFPDCWIPTVFIVDLVFAKKWSLSLLVILNCSEIQEFIEIGRHLNAEKGLNLLESWLSVWLDCEGALAPLSSRFCLNPGNLESTAIFMLQLSYFTAADCDPLLIACCDCSCDLLAPSVIHVVTSCEFCVL